MADTVSTFIRAVKLVLKKYYPDLDTPYRHPCQAKVVSIDGNRAELQLLDKYGQPDADVPILPGIWIPERITGIVKGTKVRVAFEYNDPSMPFIMDLLV